MRRIYLDYNASTPISQGALVAMAPYLGHKVALRLLGDPAGETPFEETPFPAVPFFSGQSWFLAPLELWYRVKDWREGSP